MSSASAVWNSRPSPKLSVRSASAFVALGVVGTGTMASGIVEVLAKGGFDWAGFGLSGPLWESIHTGLDFGAPTGTEAVAIGNGTITEVAYAGPYGIRVIDLTTVVMGPYASSVLADYGADVIKVEPPAGDVMRKSGPMRNADMGHFYLSLGRNKRSVVLDLKQDEGREVLLRLVRDADVLVYNIRPQAMARLGLGYEALQVLNPRLVYAGAYGFSQKGPYAARPAYDDLIQGEIVAE